MVGGARRRSIFSEPQPNNCGSNGRLSGSTGTSTLLLQPGKGRGSWAGCSIARVGVATRLRLCGPARNRHAPRRPCLPCAAPQSGSERGRLLLLSLCRRLLGFPRRPGVETPTSSPSCACRPRPGHRPHRNPTLLRFPLSDRPRRCSIGLVVVILVVHQHDGAPNITLVTLSLTHLDDVGARRAVPGGSGDARLGDALLVLGGMIFGILPTGRHGCALRRSALDDARALDASTRS